MFAFRTARLSIPILLVGGVKEIDSCHLDSNLKKIIDWRFINFEEISEYYHFDVWLRQGQR